MFVSLATSSVTGSLVAQQSSGGGLASLIPMVILFGVLFFVMVLPQRKQKQRHAEFVKNLAAGQQVVTTGGIHGTITHVDADDNLAHLEVDTDIVIRVNLGSLAGPAGDAEEPTDNSDESRPTK